MKINDLEGWIMRCEEKDRNSGKIKRKLFEDAINVDEKNNNEFMTVESKDVESRHFHEQIDPNSLRYKQAYSNHDFFKHDQIILNKHKSKKTIDIGSPYRTQHNSTNETNKAGCITANVPCGVLKMKIGQNIHKSSSQSQSHSKCNCNNVND